MSTENKETPNEEHKLAPQESKLSQAKRSKSFKGGPIEKEEALNNAFLYPFEKVLKALESDKNSGLSESEAKKRQEEYGPNQLDGGDEISKGKILLRQVANAMTLGKL